MPFVLYAFSGNVLDFCHNKYLQYMNLRSNIDKGCFSELKWKGKRQSQDGNLCHSHGFLSTNLRAVAIVRCAWRKSFPCIGREIFQGQLLLGPPDIVSTFLAVYFQHEEPFSLGGLVKQTLAKRKLLFWVWSKAKTKCDTNCTWVCSHPMLVKSPFLSATSSIYDISLW